MKVDIKNMVGFKERDKKKYIEAARLVEFGVKSPLFSLLVLNHQYPMPKTNVMVKGFWGCEMTNKEILTLIRSGKDLYGEADGDIDVQVKMYYSWRNVVGYTYPNSPWTYINQKFFRRWDAKYIATNIIHEACHNMGFTHSRRYHSRRKYSVPYAIGDILKRGLDHN
jgi:hypothetical protein